MSNNNFSLAQQEQLLSLEAVKSVTSKQIQYTFEFKESAVKQSLLGKTAKQIFIEAGFDVSLFAPKYCTKLVKQWRHKVRDHGQDALRAKPKGRPKKQPFEELSYEDLLFKLAYLEEENRLLKKYQALGYI
jgi:putative transposase